jgi:hypothetical protein
MKNPKLENTLGFPFLNLFERKSFSKLVKYSYYVLNFPRPEISFSSYIPNRRMLSRSTVVATSL